ncbi:hypothetical protein [Lysinibacter cavernae]|uniref:hypothetical protein n=1 Tax=Lysinibacter cavernae TaxID=1640652 RepID=UPI003623E9AC
MTTPAPAPVVEESIEDVLRALNESPASSLSIPELGRQDKNERIHAGITSLATLISTELKDTTDEKAVLTSLKQLVALRTRLQKCVKNIPDAVFLAEASAAQSEPVVGYPVSPEVQTVPVDSSFVIAPAPSSEQGLPVMSFDEGSYDPVDSTPMALNE